MGAMNPWYGTSSYSIVLQDNLRFISKVVSRSLPIIILYQDSVELSTWHFHVTIFIALDYGDLNYVSPIELVVKFPDCVLHSMDVSVLYLSFVSLFC